MSDINNSATETSTITPMMAQYIEIKSQNPDCLLFYRMGDFYEMFFDDAEKAARALDITLTRRGQHQGQDIPMCGVPVHSHESYLARLIRQGFRVAIAEQTEDPAEARKRKGKTLVNRAVVRLITPGTLSEDNLLEARAANWLAALIELGGGWGLARIDMSTGAFVAESLEAAGIASALARIAPSEILVPDRLLTNPALFEIFAEWKKHVVPLPAARFDGVNARLRLEKLYGAGTLDGLGNFGRAEVAAAGALIDYVELTQQGRLPDIGRLYRLEAAGIMQIDPASARNLELRDTLAGGRAGSLLDCLDITHSPAGSRLLAAWLAAPLTDPTAIAARQDVLAGFLDRPALLETVRDTLRHAPDLERPLGRLSLGRGGPRDLAAMRDGLSAAAALRGILAQALAESETLGPPPPALLLGAVRDLAADTGLIDRLRRALAADLPQDKRDGGFIAPGYAPELDELRLLRSESTRLVAELQMRYARETQIPTLKIKHNNVLGYFIEVTPTHADKLQPPFIHRQSLAGAVRFVTQDLSELESRIAQAADRALALELALFEDLVGEVMARATAIRAGAAALALLDCTAALADLARQRGWTRPQVDDSPVFCIEGGRHPVVEAALTGGGFVPNGCDLSPGQRLWLVTGPNMAGKSTFLRQNALIAILAQIGSFVPATRARIGIVDRLFSRVGAADDLARGRSTFMVEMVETAAILNQAGPRALVILDEIGRGTATWDGLSIAWATLEHLHGVNRCRALFATHYHELTRLAASLPELAPHSMKVKEWKGAVVFLHEIGPGAADRSYGIHVARLAGLPPAVLKRAEALLADLERGGAGGKLSGELPLFAAARQPPPPPPPADPPADSPTLARLAQIDPDSLTPRAALDLLYELKMLAKSQI